MDGRRPREGKPPFALYVDGDKGRRRAAGRPHTRFTYSRWMKTDGRSAAKAGWNLCRLTIGPGDKRISKRPKVPIGYRSILSICRGPKGQHRPQESAAEGTVHG